MPHFEPFAGIRYSTERVVLGDVVAPPYDVVGPEQRAALDARSPHNIVHIDLARDPDGPEPYEPARCLLAEWIADGVLERDAEPGYYVYRMGWRTAEGEPRQTSGVLGLLAIADGSGSVLPHERTLPRPLGDRLQQLRSCRANISPIWALSLADGLGPATSTDAPPLARCTDDDGVHHRLWRVTAPAALEAIGSLVASAPVVIADGHHRYETALAYRAERRALEGDAQGPHDLMLAYVTGLAGGELGVGAIHRLVSGLPDDLSLLDAMAAFFEAEPAGPPSEALAERVAAEGGVGLVTAGEAWVLRARPGAGSPAWVGTERVEEALKNAPQHDVTYTHDVTSALALVDKGEAHAALLLQPISVEEIAAAARAGRRLPQKTTYFFPKPRTGVVIRSLD